MRKLNEDWSLSLWYVQHFRYLHLDSQIGKNGSLLTAYVCMHMCIVCVALSMSRQLHCCAPLSLTFLEAQVWSQHLQLLLPATQRLLCKHQLLTVLTGFSDGRCQTSSLTPIGRICSDKSTRTSSLCVNLKITCSSLNFTIVKVCFARENTGLKIVWANGRQ